MFWNTYLIPFLSTYKHFSRIHLVFIFLLYFLNFSLWRNCLKQALRFHFINTFDIFLLTSRLSLYVTSSNWKENNEGDGIICHGSLTPFTLLSREYM